MKKKTPKGTKKGIARSQKTGFPEVSSCIEEKSESRTVLVGTYKGNQLERWSGWYNYPISEHNELSEAEFGKITELWLFKGTQSPKIFRAKFIGIKTREELVTEYGYPVKGKAHGGKYLLFQTHPLYRWEDNTSLDRTRVIIRLKDFATSTKVRKQLKAYLESPDRNNSDLADMLPDIVTKLKPKQLYVDGFDGNLFAQAIIHTQSNAIRVLELFAGVGGFRIGLERASDRYKTVWSNQWEPSTKRQDASIIYQEQFGMEGHSNEDIGKVPVDEIPPADLLVGGFPCQDYSVANTLKHSGGIEGKKGVLWWQIHRILRDNKTPPKYLFLENVDRLLKSPAKQRGRDFAIILASISDLGYAAEWRIINAADYGMPQRRRRTYIVAYRKGTQLADEAKVATSKDAIRWLTRDGVIAQAFHAFLDETTTEHECTLVGDLAELTDTFNKDGNGYSPFNNAGVMVDRQVWTVDVLPKYNGHITTLREIIVDEKDVPPEFFIDERVLKDWKYLKGPKSETRKTPDGFEYHYTEGGMAFPDSLDKPSRTIITGEGGSSPSRFKHVIQTQSGRYRRLIPLELERLNMFPDNHTAKATNSRRAFLMGNALVTGIVERIGIALEKRI